MTSPISPPPAHDRPPGSTRRTWLAVLVAVLAVLAVVAATVLVVRATGDDGSTGGSPAVATPAVSTPAVSASPSVSSATTSPTASAADGLAAFVAAATRLDQQLKAAAAAVNRSGPPWTGVNHVTAAAVQAADLRPVNAAIPAGLPPALQRAVMLVYSDLSSRRHAMGSFEYAQTFGEGTATDDQLGSELRNGHVGATRFAGDLAALQDLAASSPALTPVAATSRAAAETLLLVRYVDSSNGGCDSRGGVILTTLPAIRWHSANGSDGTIGGIAFTAERVGDGWAVSINAC